LGRQQRRKEKGEERKRWGGERKPLATHKRSISPKIPPKHIIDF